MSHGGELEEALVRDEDDVPVALLPDGHVEVLEVDLPLLQLLRRRERRDRREGAAVLADARKAVGREDVS